jgi:RNA polymerase sigma-70 factor, ECF subfamily
VFDRREEAVVGVDVESCYEAYGPMVLRRCRALLGEEQASVEAMHDVFLDMLRHAERIEDRGLSSLLWRMATNVCLNRIRSASRRPERPEGLLDLIAFAPDDEGRIVARDLLAVIFGRERPSTRTMAVLLLLDGLTLEEVAAECGLSVSGVRKRLRTLKTHVSALEDV